MSTWKSSGAQSRLTCAILTRAPSPSAAEIHDRMPVILAEAAHKDWLDPEMKDASRVAEIIATKSMDEVAHYPVSTHLNGAKTDDEDLIKPLMERSWWLH